MHRHSFRLMVTYSIDMGNNADITDIVDTGLMVRSLSRPAPGRDSKRNRTLTTVMSIYDDVGQYAN